MKYLLNQLTLAIVLLSLTSCSVDSIEQVLTNESSEQSNFTCVNADPEVRLTNNGTVDFSFLVYDEMDNEIIQQLNIAPGSISSWTPISEGNIIYSIVSGATGVADIKGQVFMGTCTTFDVTILVDNSLDSNGPVSQ